MGLVSGSKDCPSSSTFFVEIRLCLDRKEEGFTSSDCNNFFVMLLPFSCFMHGQGGKLDWITVKWKKKMYYHIHSIQGRMPIGVSCAVCWQAKRYPSTANDPCSEVKIRNNFLGAMFAHYTTFSAQVVGRLSLLFFFPRNSKHLLWCFFLYTSIRPEDSWSA